MQLQIIKFRVQNFRSISDSGWVETSSNTCLIGTNEAGKTNLLMGLWHLKPTLDFEIIPIKDYPRKLYSELLQSKGDAIFISAQFVLPEKTIAIVKTWFKREQINYYRTYNLTTPETPPVLEEYLANYELEQMIVHRKLNGDYEFEFPKINEANKKTAIITREINRQCLKLVPSFVYYSDYGNLDSEIYLPHVIENLRRQDLGEKELAKARSLRVLFKYVQVSPEEIVRLGKEKLEKQITITLDSNDANKELNKEDIEIKASKAEVTKEKERKKEREILLQAASRKITNAFKNWWKQGDYQFRFQADGNHFRIWVSDGLRPEEIELENRSKGLQWFFSFFLVFISETEQSNVHPILLLDEPGLSLHPKAQQDLLHFFATLSLQNQLLYTTHSPFLVNMNHLSKVKAVFVDKEGNSLVSTLLNKSETTVQSSLYPIYASIQMSIAQTLLLSTEPVLVQTTSDQVYLQIIKNYLVHKGVYKSEKDIVFIAAANSNDMNAILQLVTTSNNTLPFIIMDGSPTTKEKVLQLKKEEYRLSIQKIIEIDQLFPKRNHYSIEDLFPSEDIAKAFGKMYQSNKDDFEYIAQKDQPILAQMEKFILDNELEIIEDWRTKIAININKLAQHIVKKITDDKLAIWTALFNKIV